jgi:hypothetical protein
MNNYDSKAKEHFMKYCRILKKFIKDAKNQHIRRLIAKSSNEIKMIWTIYKEWDNKLHPTEQIPSLLVDNEKLKRSKNWSQCLYKLLLNNSTSKT